jgi:hypothetical protein
MERIMVSENNDPCNRSGNHSSAGDTAWEYSPTGPRRGGPLPTPRGAGFNDPIGRFGRDRWVENAESTWGSARSTMTRPPNEVFRASIHRPPGR